MIISSFYTYNVRMRTFVPQGRNFPKIFQEFSASCRKRANTASSLRPVTVM